jgi:hypothetical protein
MDKLTEVTALGFKPLIGPKDMCNQGERNHLKHEMNRHRPRNKFPLLSPCSSSSGSLAYRFSICAPLVDAVPLTSMKKYE